MPRVLIIEDDISFRATLRQILEQAGHTVFEAPDGQKGLALWHREQTDVVVTDLYMPEKDGIHVLLEIKRFATPTKVIVMCGGGLRSVIDWGDSARSLGAYAVLEKPVDTETLLTVIQDAVRQEPAAHAAAPASSVINQRKHTRSAVSLPVSFGDRDRTLTGMVLDISREGCRIHCADPVTDLQYFQVQIQLETRERIWVDLAVRRWSSNGELGVEFIKMKLEDQARLRTFIGHCEEAGVLQPC